MSFLSAIFLILALLGTLYYIVSTLALVSHFRAPRLPAPGPRPLSVLKPVCGLEVGAFESFQSYLRQDYPCYEVLFGVLDEADPALATVRDAIRGSENAAVRVGSEIDGANNKVRILDKLARHATGEILVITDADTRVTPDFLSRISAPFADESVGAVTCMYRGIEAKSAADALEGLHMTCVFAPGVAAAKRVGGIDFGLGAAIAIRKHILEATGGFEAIANYLADDFQIGRRAAKAGYKVELSDYVMDIVLTGQGIREVLARELRWARTTKVSRPLGHFGLVVTYGSAYALALAIASGFSALGWSVLVGVAALRGATAFVGARVCLQDRECARRVWLLPVRDLLSFGVWAAGYFSRTVAWRGRRLKLLEGGRMAPVE